MKFPIGYVSAGLKPAVIEWRDGQHNQADNGPYVFSVNIGTPDPTRRVLVFTSNISGASSVTVNGVGATQITANRWYIAHVPTGTTVNVVVNEGSSVHCAIEVFSLYYLKSATPLENFASSAGGEGTKSGDISVLKGGVVAVVAAGGALNAVMSWTFGGALQTDDPQSFSDGSNMGAGTGRPTVNDASWPISATRSGTVANWQLMALSFR